VKVLENYKRLIALANRENAEAEIFCLRRDLKSIRMFNNEVVEAQDIVEEGAGIRIARDRCLGFAVTNNLSRESLEKSLRSALSLAKTSKCIPGWLGFPAQKNNHSDAYTRVPQDTALASMTTDEAAKFALRMIKRTAAKDKIVHALTGALITLSEEFSVINSNGLEHEFERSTAVSSRIIVEARRGENYCTGESSFCSRTLSDFNPEDEVDRVVSETSELLSLTKKRVDKGKHEVILSPGSAGAFACYLIAPMITGRSALAGASCLTNMLNKSVASESFSLVDNGHAEGGIASASVDDEGTPTRSTRIFENGVFRNFLYDTLTASLNESESTGNARRASDTIGRTYLASPEPLGTNLVVQHGDFNFEELVEMTDSGLIVNSIGYTFYLAPERGYFNVVSNVPALVVEKGRIKGRTRRATVSGKLVDTLQNIDGIGKKTSQSVSLGSLAAFSPYLRIRNMTVEDA
jgi:PmbA protein